MRINLEPQPKSTLKITIEVSPEEYQPFLVKAAKKISLNSKIEGFRSGNAPFDLIKQKFGLMAIMEEALPEILTHTFVQAIIEKKIDTLGEPEINVTKMVPENDLVYTAVVSVMPEIKLPEISSLTIKKEALLIEDKEVAKTLDHLAKSRAAETLADHPAKDKDLVKLDYQISLGDVPLEDGHQKDLEVYLGEHHMVPGFEAQIIGLKASDHKKFDLTFPQDYFQKNYAGKACTFDVNVKGVYEITIPEINDEFAQTLGDFPTLAALEKQIKENITQEKEMEIEKKWEENILEAIIKQSTIGELPEKIISSETDSIIHEFEHSLLSRGLNLKDWLLNIGKSLEEFQKDLQPQAERRIKSALILRTISHQEKISATDEEVAAEIKKIQENYQDNQEIIKQLNSSHYKNHLLNILTGQKVMAWLKQKINQN
jgi:trigger factor